MSNPHHQIAPAIVVAVPFPAQSHLNQLLQLSCLLSSSPHNLPVYYVCSSNHVRQAKLRYSDPLLLFNIQFHDLHIPPFPSPSPIPGTDTDFPTHMHPLFEASLTLREPFAAFFQTLYSQTKKKIIVIHDSLMSYVVHDAASFPNVELYALHTYSAFNSFSWNMGEIPIPREIQIPPNLPSSREGCFTYEFEKFIALGNEFEKFRSGVLFNSCRVIEGDYLDLLAQNNGNRNQWAVGPLNRLVRIGEQSKLNGKEKCIDWLDKQPTKSVMYISFGTTSSMVDEQVKELAIGLEESKIRFIWVLRNADRGDIFAEEEQISAGPTLPQGFEERTEGVQGMVVRGWVPQAEILAHPSTGGFMTHCGWGSCMESISMGVPIATWPMHSEQPWNAAFVTQVLKIGVVVREWSRRKELVTALAVKEAVRTLMASEGGEMIRKRAEELGRAVRQASEEGGVSRVELESFINHITQ
ncbi:hypothetical protein SLA2020_016320 [Shorea laevis]